MDYNVLFSGLVGTLIGGLITWLVTINSLNKQFDNQVKLIDDKERKQKIIALKSVKNEVAHNLIQLNASYKLMKSEKMDILNYRLSNQNNILKCNKWEKHSDTFDSIEAFEGLGEIQAFYMNLYFEILHQFTSKDRVEKLIEQGLNSNKLLENQIANYD